VEKLEAARRELVEFYLTLDLPKAWGSGKTVAADGTQFDFYDNNLTAGYHFRYRKLGAVAYRHVADNYIAMLNRENDSCSCRARHESESFSLFCPCFRPLPL
jgi:TnpA family transposase